MSMALAMFGDLPSAQRAVSDLMRDGFSRDTISVLVRARDPGGQVDSAPEGPLASATRAAWARRVLGGGPLADGHGDWSNGRPAHIVAHTLVAAGMTPAGAWFIATAICEGGVLVAVHGVAENLEPARLLLENHSRLAAAGNREARVTWGGH